MSRGYATLEDQKRDWAMSYFRDAVSHLNGRRVLTVGMLRDWLDACSTDDAELMFDDEAFGIQFEVQPADGGVPDLVSTYLELDGTCWSTSHDLQQGGRTSQNMQVPYTAENIRRQMLAHITRAYRPEDDEPLEEGWTIQPPAKE